MINYLHKDIVDKYSKTNYIFNFDSIKKESIKLLTDVRSELLINYSIEEKFEITDLLKIFDVKFNEYDDKPLELLLRYVSVLIEMTKVKTIFMIFLTVYLSEEDILEFLVYCRNHDIIIVLIENKIPSFDFDKNVIAIVDDFVLISRILV